MRRYAIPSIRVRIDANAGAAGLVEDRIELDVGDAEPLGQMPGQFRRTGGERQPLDPGREGGRSRTTIEQKDEKGILEGPEPKGRGR